MTKFKVGDRVAVYYSANKRSVIKIARIEHDGGIYDKEADIVWHPKQCRKLKSKKERRVIWVNRYPYGFSLGHETREEAENEEDPATTNRLECVRFREWPEEKEK